MATLISEIKLHSFQLGFVVYEYFLALKILSPSTRADTLNKGCMIILLVRSVFKQLCTFITCESHMIIECGIIIYDKDIELKIRMFLEDL